MIDLIHIAGAGRSGSTLLEMVLANHPDAIGLGATRMVWQLGILDDVLLPAGHRFHDDPVWSRVAARFGRDEASAMHRLLGATTATRHLPESLWRHWTGRLDADRRLVVDRTAEMLRLAAEASGRAILVDSTSSAGYNMVLARVPGVRLTTVHLVRHPLAVAYSWSRPKPQPEHGGERMMIARSTTGSHLNWLTTNVATSLATFRSPRRIVADYDAFCADPAALLRRLGALLGRDGFAAAIDLDALTNDDVIGVAGNPARFAKGPIAIRRDDRWTGRNWSAPQRAVAAIMRRVGVFG